MAEFVDQRLRAAHGEGYEAIRAVLAVGVMIARADGELAGAEAAVIAHAGPMLARASRGEVPPLAPGPLLAVAEALHAEIAAEGEEVVFDAVAETLLARGGALPGLALAFGWAVAVADGTACADEAALLRPMARRLGLSDAASDHARTGGESIARRLATA